MSGSALRIGAPVAPEVEKNALQRSAPGQQAGSDILPRTSLGLRRLPVGPAEAARRNKVLLFLVVETALALLGLWLIPHVLALFFLSAGSRAMDRAIHLAGLPIPPEFACDVGPASDPRSLDELHHSVNLLRNALLFESDEEQADLLLGRAYCLLGQPEKAVQSYLTYTRLRPANPLGHLELGFAYEDVCISLMPDKNLSPGITSFKPSCRNQTINKVIQFEWQEGGASINNFISIAEALRLHNNFQDADRWYARLEIMGMDLTSGRIYAQAMVFKDAGKKEEAIRTLQQALEINRGWTGPEMHFIAWYHLGLIQYEQGMYSEGERSLQNAISVFPNINQLQPVLSEAYRFLGSTQYKQGKLKIAIKSLEKAIELNKSNSWAHINYGIMIYSYNPRWVQKTEDAFQTAIHLAPENIDVWKAIILFWQRSMETQRADTYCLQAKGQSIEIEKDLLKVCVPK